MADAQAPTNSSAEPGDDQPVPLSETIKELLSLLNRGLRPQSKFHIETANRAAAVDVGGQVLITIPTKPTDLAEVRYVGGRFRLTLE